MHRMRHPVVPWFSKQKNSVCGCSIVSSVSVYSPNEPTCGTPIVKIK